jgi:membrane protease YdiL (CAAX protease family)
MSEIPPSAEWRAAQGGLFLALLAVSALGLGILRWPWQLLVPLTAYFLLALAVPPLRRTLGWLRVGRLGPAVFGWTALVSAVSALALVGFHVMIRPDVGELRPRIPSWSVEYPVLFVIVFAILNALMEEVIFRGILFDALDSQLGVVGALVIQAIIFGRVHMTGGYPPGDLGGVLAGVYGLMLGMLRVYSRGLAAGYLAHIVADAVIAVMVLLPA